MQDDPPALNPIYNDITLFEGSHTYLLGGDTRQFVTHLFFNQEYKELNLIFDDDIDQTKYHNASDSIHFSASNSAFSDGVVALLNSQADVNSLTEVDVNSQSLFILITVQGQHLTSALRFLGKITSQC